MGDVQGLVALITKSEVSKFGEPVEDWAASHSDVRFDDPREVGRLKCCTYDPADGRNKAIRQARALECDWVFLLDDDQTWAPTVLPILLSRNVPIVQALTLMRVAPFMPIGYTGKEGDLFIPALLHPGQEGLQPRDVVGGGCLLVRREAWERIPEPWFQPGYVTGYKGQLGEDTAFCVKAKEAGLQVYQDLDAVSTHLTVCGLTPVRRKDGTWATRITVGDLEYDLPAAVCVGEGEYSLGPRR